MPLTPADVRNKQFSTTRLRPGYDEEEVDAFLDEVEAELDRLIQENEELRAKLAEVLRGGGKPAGIPALSSPLSDPKDMMMPEPPPERRQPEPMMMDRMHHPVEDNMDTAARVL
ncbi:MAG: DivIVA domain-containing protein, partial [Trebonia sp.]